MEAADTLDKQPLLLLPFRGGGGGGWRGKGSRCSSSSSSSGNDGWCLSYRLHFASLRRRVLVGLRMLRRQGGGFLAATDRHPSALLCVLGASLSLCLLLFAATLAFSASAPRLQHSLSTRCVGLERDTVERFARIAAAVPHSSSEAGSLDAEESDGGSGGGEGEDGSSCRCVPSLQNACCWGGQLCQASSADAVQAVMATAVEAVTASVPPAVFPLSGALSSPPSLLPVVPNVVHFVYGLKEGRADEFSLVSHLSMAAAFRFQQPNVTIHLYYHFAPFGRWWNATLALCGSALRMHSIPLRTRVSAADRPLSHYAHRSDVERLHALLHHGGIYMDLDVIAVRSLHPLRGFHMLMAEQNIAPGVWNRASTTLGAGYGTLLTRARGVNGLANAFMLAAPNSAFIRRWLSEYRTFDQRQWDYHSCKLPLLISEHPDVYGPSGQGLVTLAASGVFMPQAEGIPAFLQRDEFDFGGNWAVHTWGSLTHKQFAHMQHWSQERIMQQKTSFGRMAKAVWTGQHIDDR